MLDSTRAALAALRADENPERARQMQAYMKTEMAFFGVASKQRRAIARSLRLDHAPTSAEEYAAQVADLWGQPWRETKYLAIDLAIVHPRFITMSNLGLYERMIREGAWWDFVDQIASHLIGRLLLHHRREMRPVLDRWVDDDDPWIRRSAILAHLGHKHDTDANQLFDHCLRRADESDFFMRKAIGWALRQYARVNPQEVKRFVEENADRFSGLTRREALKHLS